MATFAEQANSGFDPDTSGDWWNAIQRGGYQALAGMRGLQEMAGTAIGLEGTRLTGLAGRHAAEQAAQAEYEDISSPGRAQLDSEFGEADSFWGQLAMKGLGMVAPAAASIGAGAVGSVVAGPAGGITAATLMNMGLNSGDAAQAVLSGIDQASDDELLKNAEIFNQYRSGVPMDKIRADLKLDAGSRAAAPTAIASAITGPISAETGLGLWLTRAFRPRVGQSLLASKVLGVAGGATLEAGGEALEEGTSAYGVNIAHDQLPNIIPQQDVGRAVREAAILGGVTGGAAGGVMTGRARPPAPEEAIDEAIDTGITVLPDGGLDPAIAAATAPEVVDLRPLMNQGTLTSGHRPGIMVGVPPPNVTPNVTLEEVPFEQAQEFLAQYGYTPEDLTGMDPTLRAELDERFNETYIPDRLAQSQERVNDMDPAVHAAIVSANVPGGSTPTGAEVQPPVVTPGEGAPMAGEEGIQTTQAGVAPNVFLPDRYPRARDVAEAPPAEPAPETDTGGMGIQELFTPLPAGERAQALAETRPPDDEPMVLEQNLTPHDIELRRLRQEMINREIDAQQTATQQRMIAEEKAAGTYDQGMAKTSKETQAKRDDDEDRAHTIFENAGEIPTDIDTAKQYLLGILDQAAETNLKVPLVVRKNMTNHMMWLANVRKALRKLDTNSDPAALALLADQTDAARAGDWEPMRSKHVRQRSGAVQLNEQLVAQGVPTPVEDETLGEIPDEVAMEVTEDNEPDVVTPDMAVAAEDADIGAAVPSSARAPRPAFRRYTLDKSALERRRGRKIKKPSPAEAEAAGRSIERWVGKKKSAEAPRPIHRDKIVSDEDKADALDARARSEPDDAAGDTVKRKLTPRQEIEERAARLAEEGREAEIPSVALSIAERVQQHAKNLKAKARQAKAATKTRGARQSVMETIVRKTGIKKRADTLIKEIRRELNTTPKDERNALYRAGLKEAQAAIKTARESLDDPKAADKAISRAEHILASTKPEYKGYREFGAKPGRKALVQSTKPEFRVIEGGGRKRLRNRRGQQVAPTVVAEPEDLTQRAGYREDTEGLAVSRAPLPVAGTKTVYGNPSKLFRARSKAIFNDLQKAWAAAQLGEYNRSTNFLDDILDDVTDIVKAGDNSETMQRLQAMLRSAVRDPVTVNALKSMVRITTVLRKIDPSAEIARPIEEDINAMDEAFRGRALREFPDEYTPPKQAPFKPKTPYKPKRKYGRILPDLRSEEQIALLPIEHISTRPPERVPIPKLPKRTEMAEVVTKPFTKEERALLKEYGFTDTQISNPKVLGSGARGRMRTLVDELTLLRGDTNVTSNVTPDEGHNVELSIDTANGKLLIDGDAIQTDKMKLSDAISDARVLHDSSIGSAVISRIFDEATRLRGDTNVHVISDAEMDRLAPSSGPGKQVAGKFVIRNGKGVILIRKSIWYSGRARVYALAHEAVHAITATRVNADSELQRTLTSILDEVRSKLQGAYGTKDIHELLAELANPEFVSALKGIQISNKLKNELGLPTWRKTTGWRAVLSFIGRVLGFNENDISAFEAVVQQFESITDREVSTSVERDFLKDVDRNLERETGIEMAKNALMNGSINSRGNIDRGLMKLRTNDSLMRAAEEYYPGLARKFHNLVMQRFTRGQELLNEDVGVQLERQNLYGKYADKKVGKETVKDFYEDLLLDAGDHNVDPTVSLEANNWLGDNSIGKLHYPRLRADFERLAKVAPDLARYMKKEWAFTAKKQRHIIDVTLTNLVRAFSDKDLTDEQALKIGQRIRDDEATDADKALFTKEMLEDIGNAPELKERPGVYTPQLRYGDWVVNARVNIAKPAFKNVVHQPDLDGVVYDFHGAGAEEAARKYAAYYPDGKTLRDEYSDVHEVWIKDGKYRAPDGRRYSPKDAKDGAEKRFRVHIQDRHTDFFERESDAMDAAAKLRGDKYYREVKGYAKKLEQLHGNQAAVSSRQLEAIIDQMKKHGTLAGMPKDVAASYARVLQEASRAIAPGTSINKRRMLRRHVQGASKDAGRAMHSYSVQTSNYIAAMELAPKLDAAEKDLRDAIRNDYRAGSRGASLAQEMIERRNAMNGLRNDSSPIVNAATTLVFLDKLVSVAYSVINQAQLYTNTMPRLAAKYKGANAAIAKAMSDIHYGKTLGRGFRDTGLAMAARLEQSTDLVDYIIKGGKTSVQEREMFREMVKRGTLSADAGFEVSPLVNKARTKVGQAVTGAMQYVENIGRQMPRAIDAGSRAISLLATYRLARENGVSHEEAMNIAQDITDETQFNYSPVNSPAIYNNGWGRIALQFTRYPAAMYQFMTAHAARALKGPNKAESAKALLLTFGMYTLFSGVLGGGPWEPIRAAVTLLNGMGLIDWDWSHVEATAREIAADMVGPTLGEAVTRGLPRLVGIDTSSRITTSQLLFAQPQGDLQDANGLFNYAAGYMLGPSGGFLKDIPAGIEDFSNGRYLDGVSKVFPVKIVADAMKGTMGYTEGKKTRAGDVITQYSFYDALVQSLGFTPGRVAEAAERRNAVYSQQGYNQKKASDIKQRFWETPKAERTRPAFMQEYRDLMKSYNEGKPRSEWLTFDKLRDYSKDKDRRFSRTSNAIPRDRSTDYLLERTEGVYNAQ